MPQMQLPMFPAKVVELSRDMAFHTADGTVTYYVGTQPIFSHAVTDRKLFYLFMAMQCSRKVLKQAEIVRTFGIPAISMKRAVKTYEKHGAEGFFRERKPRGAAVLVAPVLDRAQALLDAGHSFVETAKMLDLKDDTLRKAAAMGRLRRPRRGDARGVSGRWPTQPRRWAWEPRMWAHGSLPASAGSVR
jgi:hypothetical protein